MEIDKSRLRNGIWYEDVDGNYIPHNGEVDAPEEAYTCHVCFPLQISEEVYLLHDYDGHKTYRGSDILYTVNTTIGRGNENVILAMVSSGDYSLSEALAVYAQACERCSNVLAWKYLDGKDGYPEYSDEWKKCNTYCDFCKEVAKDGKF